MSAALWDLTSGGRTGPPQRQWPDLSEPSVPASLSGLSAAAGVHHAVHAGTEWDYLTVLSESQRGMCLATSVSDVRGGAAGHSGLAAVVQRRAPTSGVKVSESGPISGATINPGGLISGEHYRRSSHHGRSPSRRGRSIAILNRARSRISFSARSV